MTNVTKLETSSFASTLALFVKGLSAAEVQLHRDCFEAALRSIDAFLASPRSKGMAADCARYWKYQRIEYHRHIVHLDQILAGQPLAEVAPLGDPDPELEKMARLIAGKSIQEIARIRDELVRERREPIWVNFLNAVLDGGTPR